MTVTLCTCGLDDVRQPQTVTTWRVWLPVLLMQDSLLPRSAPCRQRLRIAPVRCRLKHHVCWIRNWFHIAAHLVFVMLVVGARLQKGLTVLLVNFHWLMASDFRFVTTLSSWWPWRYFMQKSATACWVHAASAWHMCSSVCRSLICINFILVYFINFISSWRRHKCTQK